MNWKRFFQRRKRDADLESEIQSYLEHEVVENIARGMPAAEARYAASRKFGNATRVKESVREMNTLRWLETIAQDLRYGFRQLRTSPGFACAALLSLALGIGANSAIFQLLDAVRLRALPVQNPHELAEIKIAGGNRGFGISPGWTSELTYPLFEQIRNNQQAFSSVFAWGVGRFEFGEPGQTQRIMGLFLTGETFATLGVSPHLGRLLSSQDDRRGCAAGPVVLSYNFWQSEFGGRADAIGSRVRISGRLFQIAGVTPQKFFGLEVGKEFDVALPACAHGLWQPILNARDRWWLVGIGRLKQGWTLDQAAAHLRTASEGWFHAVRPDGYDAKAMEVWNQFRLTAVNGGSGVSRLRRDYETALWLLLGITTLVLVIACANLANLLMARATVREREIAVRLAIGASRGRIVSQLLSESLLIAAVGAAAGLWLAAILSRTLLLYLSTEREPFYLDLDLDGRVLLFTIGASVLTCVIFGLAPALRATRVDPAAAMKSGGRSATSDRHRFSFQRVLMVSQIAISLSLVLGALLFVRSFANILTFDAGFHQQGVVYSHINFGPLRPAKDRIQPLKRLALEKVKQIPGIINASTTTHVPLQGGSWELAVRVPGVANEDKGNSKFTWVGPEFFETMGIPVLAGRAFNDHDTGESRKVLVVNQTFVRKVLDGADPIGKTIHSLAEPGYPHTIYEIVGVVRDGKYSALRQEVPPVAFAPETQNPVAGPWISVVSRSGLPASSVTSEVRKALAGVDPSIDVRFEVLRTMVTEGLVRERTMAWLAGLFGALAAILALIGLYGVISYTVVRRRSEIGIRLALGLSSSGVLSMIVRQTIAVTAVGAILGLALSLVLTRSAENLLFGLKPHDPLTIAGAVLLVAGIAVVAGFIPAWRASKTDAVVALRQE